MKNLFIFWTYDPTTQEYSGTDNQEYTSFDDCEHQAKLSGKAYIICQADDDGEFTQITEG